MCIRDSNGGLDFRIAHTGVGADRAILHPEPADKGHPFHLSPSHREGGRAKVGQGHPGGVAEFTPQQPVIGGVLSLIHIFLISSKSIALRQRLRRKSFTICIIAYLYYEFENFFRLFVAHCLFKRFICHLWSRITNPQSIPPHQNHSGAALQQEQFPHQKHSPLSNPTIPIEKHISNSIRPSPYQTQMRAAALEIFRRRFAAGAVSATEIFPTFQPSKSY